MLRGYLIQGAPFMFIIGYFFENTGSDNQSFGQNSGYQLLQSEYSGVFPNPERWKL